MPYWSPLHLTKSTLEFTYSRGYIQRWLDSPSFYGTDPKEQVRLNKVYAAVDELLKAGREPEPERPRDNRSTSHTLEPG